MDHVFLIDNNSQDGARVRAQLAAVFPASFLTLRSEPEARGQLKAYAWCSEEQRAAYNWLAFIDVDEFIVLRQQPCAPPPTCARACSLSRRITASADRCASGGCRARTAVGSAGPELCSSSLKADAQRGATLRS